MFIKYLLKNIAEKKSRFILVVLSIAITSALVYILLASNSVVQSDAMRSLNAQYGDTDLIVNSSDYENNYFIDDSITNDNIDESVRLCCIEGEYEYDTVKHKVSLIGIDDDDLGKLVEYKVIDNEDVDGVGITISEFTSDKYNLGLGDKVKETINGEEYEFTVSTIADNTGFLYDETSGLKMLVNRSDLKDLLKINKDTNIVYVKLVDNSRDKSDETMGELEDQYENLKFAKVDTSLIADSLNANLTIPLLIVLVVGCIMSILIIYTTTNIVVLERLPVIGTFLSIGMSQWKIIFTLLCEALVQGVIGGILGFVIGIYSAQIISLGFPKNFLEMLSEVNVYYSYGILSVAFGVILSFFSVFASVSKIKSFSIKEIILNLTTKTAKKHSLMIKIIRALIPVALIIAALLCDGIIRSVSIILCSVIVLIMYLEDILRVFAEKCIRRIKYKMPLLYVALKNVCSLKMLINNMKLIIITLALITMIGTISGSVIKGFNQLLTEFHSDVSIILDKDSPDVCNYVENDDEIANYYYFLDMENVEIAGSKEKISSVQGIENEKYSKFNTYFTYIGGTEILDDLDGDDRNIVISQSILTKLNKKVGDTITLKAKNGDKFDYKITGAVNAKLSYVGSVALISDENARDDFGINYIDTICVKLKDDVDIDGYYEKLSKSEVSKDIDNISLDYIKNQKDLKMTESFLKIINSVSMITIVLAVLGILNNNLICFIQRRKTLATLDSIGVSVRERKVILLLESVFMSLICILVSSILYYIAISNIQGILTYIGVYIDLSYDMVKFTQYSLLVVLEVLLSGGVIVGKVNKLSIIEELKYE